VKKADQGESLAPKRSPGSAPKLDEKANKLLEDNLKESSPLPAFRTVAITHRERNGDLCESLHHVSCHSRD
jgi:hypothetical protein